MKLKNRFSSKKWSNHLEFLKTGEGIGMDLCPANVGSSANSK